jgi:hypothetical protein
MGLLLVLLLPAIAVAQTSLGGMTPGDTLGKVLTAAGAPDSIQVVRGSSEATDYAVLLWETRQVGVILTPGGDKTFGVITASSSVTTNDGLTVGNSRDKVVQARGMPDEVDSVENMNAMWYWKQGAAFLLDKNNAVAMIFAFVPGNRSSVPKLISLPSDQITVAHAYQTVGQECCVFGTVRNTCKQTLFDVRLGIKLLDSEGKTVRIFQVVLGDVSPSTTIPFNTIVTPKGLWVKYEVDSQGATDSMQRERLKSLFGVLSKAISKK